MRRKIKLLLTRREGVPDQVLDARLLAEATRLQAEVSGPISFCRAYALRDRAFYAVAAGAFDAADRPFDAMMEVVADGFELPPELFGGFAGRLADLVDPSASAALVGTEHVILDGSEPLLVLIANRRLPSFSHEAFLEYWLNYHGPFAREHTPPEVGLRYRQFHTDIPATASLLQSSGLGIGDFDGAAECYYKNIESVRQLMGQTEIVDQATVDEREFVAHERCVTSVLAITPDSTSHRLQ